MSEPDHWSSNPVNEENPQPSICPTGSKFRVKANFLLADRSSLRTMMPQKTRVFRSKLCRPDTYIGSDCIGSGEHNTARADGEEKRRQ